MVILVYRNSGRMVVIGRLLLLSLLTSWCTSCANPAASIQPDIEMFQKKYPSNFGFVDSGNRKVHYAWSGDRSKRPLVFVHGSPGSWKGWAHFLLNEDLQKRFFMIAIDRLGYGGSGNGISETSLDKHAQALIQVASLSPKTVILVGHSFGGPVIAGAAMNNPQKVAGLIFVASSVSPDLERTKWFQYPATWWPIKYLIPTELRVCNEEIFPLKGELMAQKNRWFEINSKVAILQGADDQLVPAGNADYIVSRLKSESVIFAMKIAQQGHFLPWERPDLILKSIDEVERAIAR